jgi:hypothetical protein
MKTILISTALIAALAGATALAQSPSATDPSATQGSPQSSSEPTAQPQSQSTPRTASPTTTDAAAQRIAPGSVIPVQLTKTIDAKKAKPGDEVTAKVTMDLKTNSGEVLVPKDTKVTGHVTEAQARSKDQKESQVGIAFDHATLKDGSVALPMSIQAVIAPTNNENSGSGVDQGPAAGGSAPTSPMGAGRSGGMSGSGQTQASTPSPNAVPTTGTDTQHGGTRPQINGNTQGVVGISGLKLDAGQNATQGSVLSSEKNNVKVESGTMLLLKVNP